METSSLGGVLSCGRVDVDVMCAPVRCPKVAAGQHGDSGNSQAVPSRCLSTQPRVTRFERLHKPRACLLFCRAECTVFPAKAGLRCRLLFMEPTAFDVCTVRGKNRNYRQKKVPNDALSETSSRCGVEGRDVRCCARYFRGSTTRTRRALPRGSARPSESRSSSW